MACAVGVFSSSSSGRRQQTQQQQPGSPGAPIPDGGQSSGGSGSGVLLGAFPRALGSGPSAPSSPPPRTLPHPPPQQQPQKQQQQEDQQPLGPKEQALWRSHPSGPLWG
ncbi:basic salivary proline-rich protein 1-like [Sceloporus undulatus]|uniref:basic salivary proline-rich protein 1-like n=1 Tax=Sceloporus undulatus TaxID=8520 RepID=UPI001C4CAE51|nr:basic salivary proline-rich protein 1-like [Sceloporus undulatus]